MKIFVTGGAGFIGSAFVLRAIELGHEVLTLDALTSTGTLDNLSSIANHINHRFVEGDVCDAALLACLLAEWQPQRIMHFAAESHVDKSIKDPSAFVRSNVVGTCNLLQAATKYWSDDGVKKRDFIFHHISTDEVYGSLGGEGSFDELSPYSPRNPYAASKAAADHLVQSWQCTYGLPVVITNCSNNYGPRQSLDKLIPKTIVLALKGETIPIFGRGDNVRDWLYVDEHVEALLQIMTLKGWTGQLVIGGACEMRNIEIVKMLCRLLDEKRPKAAPHDKLIRFIADRPGHDYRYSINFAKLTAMTGWTPKVSIEAGLRCTMDWYLANEAWWTSKQ